MALLCRIFMLEVDRVHHFFQVTNFTLGLFPWVHGEVSKFKNPIDLAGRKLIFVFERKGVSILGPAQGRPARMYS